LGLANLRGRDRLLEQERFDEEGGEGRLAWVEVRVRVGVGVGVRVRVRVRVMVRVRVRVRVRVSVRVRVRVRVRGDARHGGRREPEGGRDGVEHLARVRVRVGGLG